MSSNLISFPVYTTSLLDCDIIRCILSYALLLPRAIVVRAIVLHAFATDRFCLRGLVGAVLSCALLSGHPINQIIKQLIKFNELFRYRSPQLISYGEPI